MAAEEGRPRSPHQEGSGLAIARRGAAEPILGAILVAVGLGLAGDAGWHLRGRAPLEEPANPGKTPHPSSKSVFFRPTEGLSEEEARRIVHEDLDALAEEWNRDTRWVRIRLYGTGPAGLLFAALGGWLLSSRRRKHRPPAA